MSLTRYKLGDILEKYDEKCDIPNLTVNDVSGINRDKEFFEPSKQVGANTSKYQVVPVNYFSTNLMHVGRDIVLPIAFNHSHNNKIVSPAYTVFRVKQNDVVLNEYLFMYFKSEEKDRYSWFYTDASIRDGLSWEDFCDIEIELPPIEIQRKYVAIYKALLANQEAYEEGLEDLKLVCDAIIDEVIRNHKKIRLGELIEEKSIKVKDIENHKFTVDEIRGISSVEKKFVDTKANTSNLSISNYKIVCRNEFSFNPNTARMGDKIPIAMNDLDKEILVSAIYPVFYVSSDRLNPKFLNLFFSRDNFDKYARFNSWGSARETFDLKDMLEVEISVPEISIQNSIADIFTVYLDRQKINEKLKTQIKSICPILIKGAMEEAGKKEM